MRETLRMYEYSSGWNLKVTISCCRQSAGKIPNINYMQDHDQWLRSVKSEDGHFIAGFADGEGSLNVSLRKRDDHAIGWQVAPSFNISQRDKQILAYHKKIFGCGTLRSRKDGVWYFEVRNVAMLHDRIIPFFNRFQFRSAYKKRNLYIFSKIIDLMHDENMNKETLNQIVELREKLNVGHGRKRKYEAHHVTGKSSETTRRTINKD